MIYPAIDLMDGGCVRLLKGDFNKRTDYTVPPLDVAKSYAAAGAEWMHVVDLDGAKDGKTAQTDLILDVAAESGLKVQTGGGLRELAQIQRLLQGGVERAVIGSLAVTNPQMVKFWISEVGQERVCVALDVNIGEDGDPYPATRGWTEAGERTLWHVLDDYMGTGLKTILVTDIGRDGVEGGSNIDLYKQIMTNYPTLDLITSGGVGTLDHVAELKALNPHGVIIGKALYEERFTLEDAIAC
ncbi:1-(5-phosphoribosyl)-5-[(5-phosphoribosylamino)methylideneamino]imidazole-4-carboxamide isomerase [Hellea balneolensis]|uniref:1-(5-phosphoribosyl)-5-[(5- phosphoribosylamino)methylideneamino]imidazole-4- carboxamide isomerase n=1 Tax=Hellea balneolensis TaxID=287478 RepID=UPI00047B19D7|nr:1-(5-phosphoribosyl)-5-[(5-phosphoribosylamino)methylideneamino]imidazole-4-carboxamide isomerase [Hellea balneolensis]